MNNLFDFITHIKGIEYLIGISAIIIFIVFWEMLKEKPFPFIKENIQNDFAYIKQIGIFGIFKTISRLIIAPIIGFGYLLILPFIFIYMIIMTSLNSMFVLIGREITFGWKPNEAYLNGKGKKEKNK